MDIMLTLEMIQLVLETEILDFLNIFYNRVEVKLDKVNDSLYTISI